MRFKAIISALAALAASTTMALAEDAVSLRLNWYFGGLHVPFYYGKERGFYKEEGIDLTINEGRGSANTVQVVAAGSDTFGLADSSSVVATAVKGAEVKSVMSLLNSTGFSVVSLASAGIRTAPWSACKAQGRASRGDRAGGSLVPLRCPPMTVRSRRRGTRRGGRWCGWRLPAGCRGTSSRGDRRHARLPTAARTR